MTLFDCSLDSNGTIKAIGCDAETHRRLVDMGLLGADYMLRSKKKRSVLADFGAGFSAVVEANVARQIEVIEKK